MKNAGRGSPDGRWTRDAGKVFLEVLRQPGREQIDGGEAKSAAEHHLVVDLVSQADARLKVVEVALAEQSGGVNDRPCQSGERVDRGGIELALLAVLGRERRLVRPADTEVQRELRRLPSSHPGSRRSVPTSAAASSRARMLKSRAYTEPSRKAAKSLPVFGLERKVSAAETIHAARQRLRLDESPRVRISS